MRIVAQQQNVQGNPGRVRENYRDKRGKRVTDEYSWEFRATKLIGEKLIARSDVKARQLLTGEYNPVTTPLTVEDGIDHMLGNVTYGHYLMSGEETKIFCFDVDFEDIAGTWVQTPDWDTMPDFGTTAEEEIWFAQNSLIYPCNPRDDWRNRAHPGRPWFKKQLREIVEELTGRIRSDLGVPTFAEYSGNKGVHIYGMTGLMSAADAREGARLILDKWGRWTIDKGKYKDTSEGWYTNYKNLSIEIYPKQDSVKPGGYGNLLRLPFGRNQKNPLDPTFVIDQTTAHDSIYPAAPEHALQIISTGNPWRKYE